MDDLFAEGAIVVVIVIEGETAEEFFEQHLGAEVGVMLGVGEADVGPSPAGEVERAAAGRGRI